MSQADLHSDSAAERLLCILGNVGSGGDSTFGPLRNEESFADHTAGVRPRRLGSSEREDWKLHKECDRILPPTSALDVRVNERCSVRLIQLDAAHTRFDGEGKTSPRILTELVYDFGKAR